MKKLTSFVLLPLLTAGLVRAEWFELDPAETSIRLLQDSPSAIRLECTVDGFQTSPVDIDGETYHRVALPGGALLLNEGAPELPILAESVIIPDDQRIRLRVLDGEYTEFDLAPAPSKGNLPRTVNPDDVPFRFGPEYSGGLYPEATTRLRDPYILRDYRGEFVLLSFYSLDNLAPDDPHTRELASIHRIYGTYAQFAIIGMLSSPVHPLITKKTLDEADLDWAHALLRGPSSLSLETTAEGVQYQSQQHLEYDVPGPQPWNMLISPDGHVLEIGLQGQDLVAVLEASLAEGAEL